MSDQRRFKIGVGSKLSSSRYIVNLRYQVWGACYSDCARIRIPGIRRLGALLKGRRQLEFPESVQQQPGHRGLRQGGKSLRVYGTGV